MASHRFNPEKAEKLISEERQKMMPVDQVIDVFNMGQDDVVADLGAGNGYFTLPMATRCKKVMAVDVEPKMLEMLQERASNQSIFNIEPIVSDLEHIQLESESVNKVLISMVMHEVGSVTKVLSEIKRILKSNGVVVVLDWEAKETESGPPLHVRIPAEEMMMLFENHGFNTEHVSLNETIYLVKAF